MPRVKMSFWTRFALAFLSVYVVVLLVLIAIRFLRTIAG